MSKIAHMPPHFDYPWLAIISILSIDSLQYTVNSIYRLQYTINNIHLLSKHTNMIMIKTTHIVALTGIIASTSAQVARQHNIRGGGAFGRKQRDLQQLSMITGTLDVSDIPEKEDILDSIPEVPEVVKEETAGKINDALEDVDLSDVPEITVAVDGVDVSDIQERL